MSDLISRAQQIKNETQVGANSANRLGGLFEDIINKIEITDVTYDELVALINSSSLKAGSYYRITDYRTVHYMIDGTNYSKTPYSWQKVIKDINGDLVVNTGPVEPLIVFAIGSNKIHAEAFSEMYPNDIIYYDWDFKNWEGDISFGEYNKNIVPGFKGVIHYRINTVYNIQTPGDFRAVKTRRWKTSKPVYYAVSDYILPCSTHFDAVDPDDYKDLYMFHDFRKDDIFNFEGMEISNIVVEKNAEDSFYTNVGGTVLTSNLFYVDGEYAWLYLNNIHLKGSSYFNTFVSYSERLQIGSNFCYNILAAVQDTIIGNFVVNCIFSGYSSDNILGSDVTGVNFSHNVLNSVFGNYLHNSFFGEELRYIKVGNYSAGMKIGDYMSYTEFGNLNRGIKTPNKTAGTKFQKNKFPSEFWLWDDAVFVQFDVSNIDDVNKLFTITAHGLGDPGEFVACRFNKISGSNLDRHVENQIYIYRIIDENTLNLAWGGDGIAPSFRTKPATGVYKLTPVTTDFSAATHVYGDYDCEIFKRADGEFRLKYIDATDATVIVDPTA